jgi:phosphoglycerate dehydrogenase-like enzyme
MSNVIAAPHIAGRSVFSENDTTRITNRSFVKMPRGIVPRNAVNPDAIPPWKSRMAKIE